MNWRHNVTPYETIEFLRESAIRSNAGPLVVDAIDELFALAGMEGEIEKKDEEINKVENDRDDLHDELSALVERMETACEILESIHEKPAEASEFFDFADLKELQRQLAFAQKALERHK